MNTPHPDPRVASLVDLYERLTVDDVAWLGKHYTEQAFFKDPFNEVRDLAGVQRIFAHMFEGLEAPRFEVLEALAEGEQCFLSWNFLFRLKGQSTERRIHGSSHLRFAPDGRVAYHRDYWDAAEELYEKQPVLGALMRWLRRKLATPLPA